MILAEGDTGGLFNSDSVRNLLLVLVGFVAIVCGLTIIASAKRAKTAEVMQTGLHVVVGFIIVGLGAGTFSVVAFGDKVAGWLGL
jgi:hypothetical protein